MRLVSGRLVWKGPGESQDNIQDTDSDDDDDITAAKDESLED